MTSDVPASCTEKPWRSRALRASAFACSSPGARMTSAETSIASVASLVRAQRGGGAAAVRGMVRHPTREELPLLESGGLRWVTVAAVMKIGEGAWCWFNEPRALETEDVTITGWVGRNGDICVASYNNVTGKLVTRTLHPKLQCDDHANPAFHLRQDGRITAFYSSHCGTPLYQRTTTRPARVAQWGPESTVPTNTPGGYGYTYPTPIWSPPEGRLYLFWRGASFLPTFSTSGDEGETWEPARTLIGDDEPGSSQRPYVKRLPGRRHSPGLHAGAPA